MCELRMFSLEVCFEQSFCERGECFRWLPYPITMLSPVYQRACLPAEGSRHVLGRTLLSKRVWNCGCRCERELCWVKLPWTITGNNNININETCCISGIPWDFSAEHNAAELEPMQSQQWVHMKESVRFTFDIWVFQDWLQTERRCSAEDQLHDCRYICTAWTVDLWIMSPPLHQAAPLPPTHSYFFLLLLSQCFAECRVLERRTVLLRLLTDLWLPDI